MRTTHKAGLLATLGLAVAGFGCAYKTPGISQDLTPGEVTQKDTPYSMKEMVYGEGNRVFVRKLEENQKPSFKEKYANVSLIPVKGSEKIITPSKRILEVKGENYVLALLGEDRTIEILGEEGKFKDYFKPTEGINTIRNRDIPFKLDTIKMEIKEEKGEKRVAEFYKILAEKEEDGKLGLYLVSKEGAKIVLTRGKEENRIAIRGKVYQPTKTEIKEVTPEPTKPLEQRQKDITGRLLSEVTTPTPKSSSKPEEKPKEEAKRYLEDYVADLVPTTPGAQKGYNELIKDMDSINEIRRIIKVHISKGNTIEAKTAVTNFANRGYQEQATEKVFGEEMTAKEGLLKQLNLEIKQK